MICMSNSRDFKLNKTFHSEQERRRFFYKLRSGKVLNKSKMRNDLLDKKTGKIYRKKEKKNTKIYF